MTTKNPKDIKDEIRKLMLEVRSANDAFDEDTTTAMLHAKAQMNSANQDLKNLSEDMKDFELEHKDEIDTLMLGMVSEAGQ